VQHLVVVIAVLVAASFAQAPAGPVSEGARVDELFARWNRSDSPGCAVGVSRNGVTVLERGYGMANLEAGTPITPDTVFHVASVSKQFTAMSILLLVERGRLSLEDEVRKHIPGWSVPTSVKIRHLLTHTGGVRDVFLLIGLMPPRDRATPHDALVRLLAKQRGLNFSPGAEFQYSNSGYVLLATIVQRASGRTLRAFADANIFKPLGMTRTHVHDDPKMPMPDRALGYRQDGSIYRVAPHEDLGLIVGTTALMTTVRDMLRWQQNFTDIRVGAPQLLTEMQKATPLSDGSTSDYGFGLQIGEDRRLRTIEHGGGDPGFAAYVIRYPDQRLAAAVLCNTEDVNATIGALARDVARVFLPQTSLAGPAPASPPPVAPVSLSAAQLEQRTGLYRDASIDHWGDLARLVVRDGALTVILGSGFNIALTPVSEHRFLVPGMPITVDFVPAAAGPAEMHVTTEGKKKPDVLRRLPPFAPSRAALRAYAGAYANRDLDVVYAVSVRDGELSIRVPGRDAVALRPIAPDVFEGFNVVEFSRGANGGVTGFIYHSTGVRRLSFERVRVARTRRH